MLTQEDCAFCEHAHGVLERLREEFPLEIHSIDIGSEEGRLLAERGGVMFAPGIFVAGEPFSYGRLSERRLRRHLGEIAPQRTSDT